MNPSRPPLQGGQVGVNAAVALENGPAKGLQQCLSVSTYQPKTVQSLIKLCLSPPISFHVWLRKYLIMVLPSKIYLVKTTL